MVTAVYREKLNKGCIQEGAVPAVYRKNLAWGCKERIWSVAYTGENQRHTKDGAGHNHLIVKDKTLKPDAWNRR